MIDFSRLTDIYVFIVAKANAKCQLHQERYRMEKDYISTLSFLQTEYRITRLNRKR